ncbi:MAG TPA: nuclear transport factor 2 family protein [Steroidobacteraceae bacterium]|nr:nuclear transport factor 2 family protein [Steroidobacteraceae bacterium]
MMSLRGLLLTLLLAGLAETAHAQIAPVAAPDQLAMLRSADPTLARNKRFVFDFWRIVFEGGHMDQAPKYMAETYIQHNPNVQSGRAAFIRVIGKARPPKPIADRIKVPVISITAERDIVTVATVRKVRDLKHPAHIYYMTWFDMFRIDDHGLIAEHWDPSELWVDGKPPGAEFLP